MSLSCLRCCLFLCFLLHLCTSTKRKLEDLDILDDLKENKRNVNFDILDQLRNLPQNDVNEAPEIIRGYMFPLRPYRITEYMPEDMARKLSWLYDNFISSGMQHFNPLLFALFVKHGNNDDESDEADYEIFYLQLTQELCNLQFEGWAELAEAAIQQEMLPLFTAVLLAMPKDQKLSHRVFYALCQHDPENETSDSARVSMLYFFIKSHNIPLTLELEEFVDASLPDQVFETSLGQLLSVFCEIPSDLWDLNALLVEFSQTGLTQTIMKHSLRYMRNLEEAKRWNEAMSIRLKLIGNMEFFVQPEFLDHQKILYKDGCIEDSEFMSASYDLLIREVKESPNLLNRAFDLIIEENSPKAMYPLLEKIPEGLHDLILGIMEKAENPEFLLDFLKDDLRELRLNIDFSYQNGRIPIVALQRNCLHLFKTSLREFVINVTVNVLENVHHQLKQIIINQEEYTKFQFVNLLSGFLMLRSQPSLIKDLLITVIDHRFHLLMKITKKLKFPIVDESIFPLEEAAKAAIQNGDVDWCEILSSHEDAANVLSFAAGILMSKDFPIPECVQQFLGI